jgi:hypothetical protein
MGPKTSDFHKFKNFVKNSRTIGLVEATGVCFVRNFQTKTSSCKYTCFRFNIACFCGVFNMQMVLKD